MMHGHPNIFDDLRETKITQHGVAIFVNEDVILQFSRHRSEHPLDVIVRCSQLSSPHAQLVVASCAGILAHNKPLGPDGAVISFIVTNPNNSYQWEPVLE
jgi:hypothetical protein